MSAASLVPRASHDKCLSDWALPAVGQERSHPEPSGAATEPTDVGSTLQRGLSTAAPSASAAAAASALQHWAEPSGLPAGSASRGRRGSGLAQLRAAPAAALAPVAGNAGPPPADHRDSAEVLDLAAWPQLNTASDAAAVAAGLGSGGGPAPVATTTDETSFPGIAAAGTAGPSQEYPYLTTIQAAFGSSHDLSQVKCYVGGHAAAANEKMGSSGYTFDNSVVFAQRPSLALAAHEAAHIVQQRSGLQLSGGVGSSGDDYEHHADLVAQRVSTGQSAVDLLRPYSGQSSSRKTVQHSKGEPTFGVGTFSDDWTLKVRDNGRGGVIQEDLDKGNWNEVDDSDSFPNVSPTTLAKVRRLYNGIFGDAGDVNNDGGSSRHERLLEFYNECLALGLTHEEAEQFADTFGRGQVRQQLSASGVSDPILQKTAQQLDAAMALLGNADAMESIELASRAQLIRGMLRSKQSLDRFVKKAEQGSFQKSCFMIAGTGSVAIVADDATGVGVADDVLLIGTGLIALVGLISTSPLTSQELEPFRIDLTRSLTEVADLVSTVLMAQKAGEKLRGATNNIAIHLARILGESVGGMPPDHQEDPNRDRKHWWKEIKNWLRQIKDLNLSPKQLQRELLKRFTPEQIESIREAIKKAASLMGEEPPFSF